MSMPYSPPPATPPARRHATLIVLLAAFIFAGLLFAGCGVFVATAGPTASPSPKPTTDPTPVTPTVDAQARSVCGYLAQAAEFKRRAAHETPPPGWNATASQMNGITAILKARDAALKSQVPAVREWGADPESPLETMTGWCDRHGLK